MKFAIGRWSWRGPQEVDKGKGRLSGGLSPIVNTGALQLCVSGWDHMANEIGKYP
jgi:hypothetical protein